MCNVLRDRLTIRGLVLAALLFVICSVAWTHTTLEASLNLLWVLLAFGALVHWKTSGHRAPHVRRPGLLSLVFVLSLLFPVISANDDLAQLDLINDAKTAQSVSIETEKQLQSSAGPLGLPAELAITLPPILPLIFELAFGPVPAACVAIPGDASGNHSPPLC